MAISLATVGGKITAAFINLIIGQVNRQGLTAIIPTSVAGTGVTLGSGGKVAISSGGATASVNGCFTSGFANYLIKISTTHSSAGTLFMRLRLSGTDASGATDYVQTTLGTGGTSAVVASPSTSSMNLDSNSVTGHVGSVQLENPAVAAATYFVGDKFRNSTGGWQDVGGRHILSTAYDGFTILAGAGTITSGTIRIYGYNDN